MGKISKGEGKCYRLPLKQDGGYFYAKNYLHGVTSFFYDKEYHEITIPPFEKWRVLYSNFVHVSVPKEGGWTILGKQEITEQEIKRMPKFFRQDFTNLFNCKLVIPGIVEDTLCRPEDCVGLERAAVFDSSKDLYDQLLGIVDNKPHRLHDLYRLRIPGIDPPFDFSSKLPNV